VYFQLFFWDFAFECKRGFSILTPKDLFPTNFVFFLDKTNWGKFGKSCFSSINLTNFANILEKFAKVSMSQIWKKENPATTMHFDRKDQLNPNFLNH
jgi:hypothetical protein